MLTASNLILSVNKKIHGAKGKIGDDSQMYRILNEAVRSLRNRTVDFRNDGNRVPLDLIGLKRVGKPIALFRDIMRYPCPADLEFGRVIELRDEQDEQYRLEATFPDQIFQLRNPVYGRRIVDNERTFTNRLGLPPQSGAYAVDTESAKNFLWISGRFYPISATSTVMLSACDTVSDSSAGTWVGSNGASNLRPDTQGYKEGSASLAFDSAGNVTLTLTNSTIQSTDLSGFLDLGTAFLWLYVPDTTMPSSVELKWGSSAADYYTATATMQHTDLPFVTGWNEVGFAWDDATPFGSPVDTAITYCQVNITNPSIVTAPRYRIDAIRFCNGREFVPRYTSTYAVVDVAGVRKAEFTVGSDQTVFMGNEDDLLIEEATIIALKELRQFDEADDRFTRYYEPALKGYVMKNPPQTQPRSYTYYKT